MKKATFTFLFFLLLACGLIIYIYAQASSTRIHTYGTVKAVGVEVFWDAECLNQVLTINWTTLEPSQVKNVTIFIKNTSNVPVNLSMSTENWQPENASAYLSLTWDSEGKNVNVNEATSTILSLYVAPNITGITSFTFDIIIAGVG